MLRSKGLLPLLLLAVLALGFALPGIATLPPLDRDEARFAQATKQMLETGDFTDIRFQDEARHKKPAGIHWLQAASVAAAEAVTGRDLARAIWAYRLPSAVGATIAVLLTFAAGRRLFAAETAFLGAALLAGSLLLVGDAHQAKTDAVLLACVVAAQLALAACYAARLDGARVGRGTAALFWVALGVGILIKGPIAPLVGGLTALALAVADRRVRWLGALRPLWGVPLMVAIALPWLVAVQIATGGAFLAEAVGGDLLPKLAGAQESHGGPPGTYLLLATLTLWPASLYLWPAGRAAWRERASPAVRFCLAWLVPSWILFEAVPTKLPHYVLPLYPALALLVAHAVERAVRDAPRELTGRLARANIVAWLGLAAVLAAAVAVAPAALGPGLHWPAVAAAAGIAALAAAAGWLAWIGRPRRALAASLATSLALVWALAWIVTPRLDRLWVSRAVVAAREAAGAADAPLLAVGYHEPSLVFLAGTGTGLVDAVGAADRLAADRAAVAVVDRREREAFETEAAGRGVAVETAGRVDGLNYANGRDLALTLYRASAAR